MNDALQQKIVEILTQFQQGVSSTLTVAGKAAPQVVEYAIRVKFYDGLGTIVVGLVALFFSLVILSVMYRNRASIFDAWEEADNPAVAVGSLVFGIASLILLGVALTYLCDTWNWIAVCDPKIALAHDLFEKVMGRFGQ